jgi:mannose-6-phosphate isomerase-like protein (cupin superfamily)
MAGSEATFKVAHVDEIPGIDYREDSFMRPVREHFGISAFGTNAWRGENVGDRLMPSHDEDPGNEELYVVLRGRARFEIDGEAVDAPAGTLVFCAPEANRTAFAEEAGTAVLAVGSTVGEAYHGGGWEVWAQFNHQYEAGEYDALIESGRETLEASGYAAPLYNLACCEALTGRTDDAIGHLRVAIDKRPSLRDLAKEDSDFDTIREEPGFQQLVGATQP